MPGLIRLELLTDFFNKIGQQPTSRRFVKTGVLAIWSLTF